MKVAQAKIEMIKPEEVNMGEYEASIVCEVSSYVAKCNDIFFRRIL